MTVRVELDLVSYDRLFPAQDFMPKGSFGNLIALPLHGGCCKRGTTLFLDPTNLEPFEDQWAFLSSLEPVSVDTAQAFAAAFAELATGPDASTYRRPMKAVAGVKPPVTITARAGAMLAIDRIGIPPALLAALKHLASLHNPDFYEKDKLRLSTWRIPRFIRCYRETLDRLLLPRGLRDKAKQLVADAGSGLDVRDGFGPTEAIGVGLVANLSPQQQVAVNSLSTYDLGTLVAPPGSGKTVVGCAMIAHHHVPTLVIVDRQPLVEQWRDRLVTHLDLAPRDVGRLGGARSKATGVVDLATVQTLARRDDVDQLTNGYGLVIVDECHHIPAVIFERAVRQVPVRRWLGLTATPYRRDGLQALMAMHCGPVRHTMSAPPGSALRALDLIVHETTYRGEPGEHIQTTLRGVVEDVTRTTAICDDVTAAARS